MSEAVEKRRARFSPEVLAKMQELGRMISAEKYGDDRPPIDLTWNEIEELGHEIGKLTATEFDQTVQRQQAESFDISRSGPQCSKPCGQSVKHRDLTTRDGQADLSEPEFHCAACERFIPSADIQFLVASRSHRDFDCLCHSFRYWLNTFSTRPHRRKARSAAASQYFAVVRVFIGAYCGKLATHKVQPHNRDSVRMHLGQRISIHQ